MPKFSFLTKNVKRRKRKRGENVKGEKTKKRRKRKRGENVKEEKT